jgi:hypothetical protein
MEQLNQTQAASAAAAVPQAPTDLNDLDVRSAAAEGAEVELYHPVTGKGLSIFVTVVGKDSEDFKDVQSHQNRRRMGKMAKGGQRAALNLGDDVDADRIELLALCTRGWRGMVLNGQAVAFSAQAAESLYMKYPWMAEQVDQAIGDRSLFMKV